MNDVEQLYVEKMYDLYATSLNAAYCIGVNTSTVSRAPVKDILENIDDVTRLFNPPSIPVWIGDKKLRDLPECPPFMESDMIDPDTLYVVAGVGIVLGANVVPKIWEAGVLSKWVKDPPKGDNKNG